MTTAHEVKSTSESRLLLALARGLLVLDVGAPAHRVAPSLTSRRPTHPLERKLP